MIVPKNESLGVYPKDLVVQWNSDLKTGLPAGLSSRSAGGSHEELKRFPISGLRDDRTSRQGGGAPRVPLSVKDSIDHRHCQPAEGPPHEDHPLSIRFVSTLHTRKPPAEQS